MKRKLFLLAVKARVKQELTENWLASRHNWIKC